MEFNQHVQQIWKSETYERFSIIRNIIAFIYWFMGLFVGLYRISSILQLHVFRIPQYESIERFLTNTIITQDDITYAYNYLYYFPKGRQKKYTKVQVFTKFKKGDPQNPINYRYLMNHSKIVKVADRILLSLLSEWLNNTIIVDRDIFKNPIFKKENIIRTAEVADINTRSIHDVVLLDIKNAYDNVEWYLIRTLLYNNLKRKIGRCKAFYYVNKYIMILYNREITFEGIKIDTSKGIPQGLPSSVAIFTFIMEEIIYNWRKTSIYEHGIDYLLNIYVDDIYLKILNLPECKNIVMDLITCFNKYNFKINFDKCKADHSICSILSFRPILETDKYLGIPFTRDLSLYLDIIFTEFYERHNINIHPSELLNILNGPETDLRRITYGFFNYKLYPLIKAYRVRDLKQLLQRLSTMVI
jgi:hypothetical protein